MPDRSDKPEGRGENEDSEGNDQKANVGQAKTDADIVVENNSQSTDNQLS
jgi:hypothetical protein